MESGERIAGEGSIESHQTPQKVKDIKTLKDRRFLYVKVLLGRWAIKYLLERLFKFILANIKDIIRKEMNFLAVAGTNSFCKTSLFMSKTQQCNIYLNDYILTPNKYLFVIKLTGFKNHETSFCICLL